MSKSEAVFACGYCGKKTEMSAEEAKKALDNSLDGACDCGHISYSSVLSIRADLAPDWSKWKMAYLK